MTKYDDNFTDLGKRYVPDSNRYESEHENDSRLLASLLSNVSDSIETFKPSASLADFSAAEGKVEEVDVVCSGGGLKGYFVIGARAVLESQLKQRNLKIVRYAGASAGAWAAMFMASGVTTAEWLRSYTKTRECFESGDASRVLQAYREQILPWIWKRLPSDAYKRCSGRCFISISVLDRFGWLPRNMIVSEYSSNEDLINACFASSCIPFVVEKGLGPRFRGVRVVDGGLTNNTPCFTDGARRQIVLRLEHVPYDWRAFAFPTDPCIEALALNGALMMARFLEGREVGMAISWDADGGRGVLEEVLLPSQLRRAIGAWWQHRRKLSAAIAVAVTILALRFLRRRPSVVKAVVALLAAVTLLDLRRALQAPSGSGAGTRGMIQTRLAHAEAGSKEHLPARSRNASTANLERLL